ncbi:MAG: TetR/AcrR family transcriptional regulator [Salinivirgaceae bacterium]
MKISATKKKIIEQSIALLNTKGAANVKMRDVSSALNMSVGNLTYHYPKWEKLMDEIFGLFQTDMDALYSHFPKDISEVALYINRIYNLQMRYAFIFADFYVFFQQYPKYAPIMEAFFPERMNIMREALQRLIEKKYLYPESEKHNYDLLVKNTWLILSGWHGFSMILKDTTYAFSKKEFFLSIWNIYVAHLTQRGKLIVRKSYRTLLNNELYDD